eukprot:314333-Chlamydomonas_euryale.AAC.2
MLVDNCTPRKLNNAIHRCVAAVACLRSHGPHNFSRRRQQHQNNPQVRKHQHCARSEKRRMPALQACSSKCTGRLPAPLRVLTTALHMHEVGLCRCHTSTYARCGLVWTPHKRNALVNHLRRRAVGVNKN